MDYSILFHLCVAVMRPQFISKNLLKCSIAYVAYLEVIETVLR